MKFIPDEVRARSWTGRLAFQIAEELDAFVALLQEKSVRNYLEIGSRDGDTFHAVMSALPKGSRGVAVDLPGEAWGSAKSKPRLLEAIADLRERGYKVDAIFGDSQAAGIRQMAMATGPYDAVFIDGDHRYDGVKADWENYGRMGRIVAFHDIAGGGYTASQGTVTIEVDRLWREIKDGFEHVEFVARDSIMGIGVILK